MLEELKDIYDLKNLPEDEVKEIEYQFGRYKKLLERKPEYQGNISFQFFMRVQGK